MAKWTPLCGVDIVDDALETYSTNFPTADTVLGDVKLVALTGEPVVDYSLRLKEQLVPQILTAIPEDWRGTTVNNSNLCEREEFSQRLTKLLTSMSEERRICRRGLPAR